MAEKTYKVISGLVKHRVMSEVDWALADYVLLQGEIAITTLADGVVKMKVGNGTAKWSELAYTDKAVNALIEAVANRATVLENKEILDLQTAYLPALANLPAASIAYGDTDIASVMNSAWFPVIADDSQLAIAVGIENLEPVFVDNFPSFKDLITNGTYVATRDLFVNAIKDYKSGSVFITNTENNISTLYTLLSTEVEFEYNGVKYTVPVYKYQNIAANTPAEQAELKSALKVLEDNITKVSDRVTAIEKLNDMNIIGYGFDEVFTEPAMEVPVLNDDGTFTDGTTTTINPYEKGFPYIADGIVVDTFVESGNAALFAKYFDANITAEDVPTEFVNAYIVAYQTFVAAHSTNGVFDMANRVGDTYIDLPVDTVDTDYDLCTLVGYPEGTATVYRWVFHKSDKVKIDQIEKLIASNKAATDAEISAIKEGYVTKENLENKLEALGTLFNIVDVIDTVEELPGYVKSTGKVMEGVTEEELDTLGIDITPGSVYVVGDETVDNKSEYVWILDKKSNPDYVDAETTPDVAEFITTYWWEYLGKISEVDMKNYYKKTEIDTLLNEVKASVTDLGVVMDYKGTVASIGSLPSVESCDFVAGHTLTFNDDFEANKQALEILLDDAGIELGDVYFVGTNLTNTVGYVFINSTKEDGSLLYRWQPLGKIYDADITALKNRLNALEVLTILNINSFVNTTDQLPGGTNMMYYTEDTVNLPDPTIYTTIEPPGIKGWESISTPPYKFEWGSALVYNNEIHLLGGNGSDTKHYKYDTTSSTWVEVSTLPYGMLNGCAVVHNGEIHIIGGSGSGPRKHCTFNGTEWTELATLPYDFGKGSAVIYNNEIHILGSVFGGDDVKHYKYDESTSTWVSVSTLPYAFSSGGAVVLNNEIHIFGGNDNTNMYHKHYKYDGSTWTELAALPYRFLKGSALVYNNEIHLIGGGGDEKTGYGSTTNHYKYDESTSTWVEASTLPCSFGGGCAVVHNGEIHIFESELVDSVYINRHYKLAVITIASRILDYHKTVKADLLDNYDIGDIIYVANDLNTTTVSDINVDAAVPYILLGYTVKLPMYPDADTTRPAATDAKPLMVYKWVNMPSKDYMAKLEIRMQAAELKIQAHGETLTDHEKRIKVLETDAKTFATVTYVEEKINALGKLLNIKGVLATVEELPGYSENVEIMTGITAEEVATIETTLDMKFRVGDVWLVDNKANDNKYEYAWTPIEVTTDNPEYVDEETTPEIAPTITVTKYRWEKLGSISGVDLENYYTKALADEIFLRKDDETVVKTTDSIIIDGEEGAEGVPGGTSISNTPIQFTKAATFAQLNTSDSLGGLFGKLMAWYDAINYSLVPVVKEATIEIPDWVGDETNGYSVEVTVEDEPFMGMYGLVPNYTEAEYNECRRVQLDCTSANATDKKFIFHCETLPTMAINLEIRYVVQRKNLVSPIVTE